MPDDSRPHSEHFAALRQFIDSGRIIHGDYDPEVVYSRTERQEEALAALRSIEEQLEAWADLMNYGWTIIANAGAGNWQRESEEWQEAAAKWRDQYHELLASNPASRSSDGDRRVHASAMGEEIVRYDRAGKWYIELVSPSLDAGLRKHVGIGEAVSRALELRDQGGEIHLNLPGGGFFDARVRASIQDKT